MTDQADKTVIEIYAIANQLIDAYDKVMKTLYSIVSDAAQTKRDVEELEVFIKDHLTDAVTARDTWIAIATTHREKVDELRVQIKLLTDEGHKIEVEIPIKKGVQG